MSKVAMNGSFVLLATLVLAACNRTNEPAAAKRGVGFTRGAVESQFQCQVKMTYHAATDTTYVDVERVDGTTVGAEVVVPGYFVLAGRPVTKTYATTDPSVRGAVLGIRGTNSITLVGGKNLATGKLQGRAVLVFQELVEAPGAELSEDQMYVARGRLDADLETSLDPQTSGAVHMTVNF